MLGTSLSSHPVNFETTSFQTWELLPLWLLDGLQETEPKSHKGNNSHVWKVIVSKLTGCKDNDVPYIFCSYYSLKLL